MAGLCIAGALQQFEDGEIRAGASGQARRFCREGGRSKPDLQHQGHGFRLENRRRFTRMSWWTIRSRSTFFAIAGLLCLGVGVLFSVVISRNLTRPIKKLQDKMMEVEKGNFDIRVPVGHSREISGLAATSM